MPSYKTAFGSFLKTEDLQGHAIKAVFEAVQIEDVKGDDGVEKKLVAHFVGKDKALILNRTNCEAIEQIVGSDDYEKWIGKAVVLFPTTTKFGAKTVPCLRIRSPQVPPPPAPVVVPADTEDLDVNDIPF